MNIGHWPISESSRGGYQHPGLLPIRQEPKVWADGWSCDLSENGIPKKEILMDYIIIFDGLKNPKKSK